MGGAAFGPTGTGKSETCKELAKTLGHQSLVVNCGDTLPLDLMTRLLKGVAQTPTWACLDEFNRFSEVTQSAVAVLL